MSLVISPRKGIQIYHPTYYYQAALQPRGSARVITVYDMIHELFPDGFRDAAALSKRKARAVRDADHVICISERTREDVIGILDIARDKTSVVHLGHSLHESRTSALPNRNQPPMILFVGERSGYKNFSLLLEALAATPSLADAYILCFGGGRLSDDEIAQLDSLRIHRSRVKHTGGNDEALAFAYASAAVFVCPSRYEGFGIPVIEAMSQGCPVACARAGSLPEVAGDAALYFDPAEPEELAEALKSILTDAAMSGELKRRGYAHAKAYSWSRCAMETLGVYRELLGAAENVAAGVP
jgi:glycosyltransferase involved in cell wall biosynthesis